MRRRTAIASCCAIVSIASSCVQLSIDPSEIGSIEFPPLPNASIIAGDTLRDGSGKAYALVARVFDAGGNPLTSPQPEFLAADTLLSITAESHYVIARAGVTGTARLLASVGSLQSRSRSIDVVPTPDAVSLSGVAQDTILYSSPGSPADTTAALGIRVAQTAGTGVKSILVTYTVRHAGAQLPVTTDTTQQFSLIDPSGQGSAIDTTGTDGSASRRLRFRASAGRVGQDTVYVLASVLGFRGVAVAGSPLQFVVVLQPRP